MFTQTLKAHVRWLLLIIGIGFVIFSTYESVSQNQRVNEILYCTAPDKVPPGLPIRLTIPVINVNADVQYVGITLKGEMDVPSNTVDVGWFKPGPRPGENGSAVIAGHFTGENGKLGVFADLSKLKEGDILYIEDDKGTSTVFVVRESRTYDPGYADEVFSSSDGAHLNLITCDGVWNEAKKSYNKRLVIFADLSKD